ncbi:hypothetical protein MUP01_12115 [Candidatus Bathyarchaeota archaeon]|nr:hypothetical protein [Candidatus Bathyarchaeota archaeon]
MTHAHNHHAGAPILGLAIISLMIIGFMTLAVWSYSLDEVSRENIFISSRTYSIYSATLPFGEFFLEGSVGGNFLGFRGTISESEVYIIKYLDGNTLKTISLKSNDTPLIIEQNSFKIVFSEWGTLIHQRNGGSHELQEPGPRDSPLLRWTSYDVYIPYLPNATFGEMK